MDQQGITQQQHDESEPVVVTAVPYPGTLVAAKMFEQLETRDLDCGQWLVSALMKIEGELPQMTVKELTGIVRRHMPVSAGLVDGFGRRG